MNIFSALCNLSSSSNGGYGGYHELTTENVDKYVPKQIGNYRISYYNPKDKKYYIKYVGRDDVDVNRRLKEHISAIESGEEPDTYTHFRAVVQTCKTNAYHQECKDYHEYKGHTDNQRHPQKPDGMNCRCPVEGCEFHWSGRIPSI